MSMPSPQALTHEEAKLLSENRASYIISVSITLIVLATLPVALRLFARYQRNLSLKSDDYMIVPGSFCTVALCVENIISVHYGNGRHANIIGIDDLVQNLKITYFLSIFYSCAHFFIKMSLLLLYRRIFTTRNQYFRIAFYTTMAYVCCLALASLLVCSFQCTPINYLWSQAMPGYEGEGHCIAILQAQWITSFLNTVGDFMILALPTIILYKMRLIKPRRIGLMILFCFGIFACASGIARVAIISNEQKDITWEGAEIDIWTAMEPTAGIICACFPVLIPAFTGEFFRDTSDFSSLEESLPKAFGMSPKRIHDDKKNRQNNHSGEDDQFTVLASRQNSVGYEMVNHEIVVLPSVDKEYQYIVRPAPKQSVQISQIHAGTPFHFDEKESRIEPAFIREKTDIEWMLRKFPLRRD